MNYYNIHMADLEQYIVKPGDSLYMIAKKYGVTVEELKQSNHLASNMIYPNQVLFIPKTNCKTTQTTTSNQHSDSVNELINKYSYTLNEITNYKLKQRIEELKKQQKILENQGKIEESISLAIEIAKISKELKRGRLN